MGVESYKIMANEGDDFRPSGNYNVDEERKNLHWIRKQIKELLLALLDLKRSERRSRKRLSNLGKKGAETKKRRGRQEDLFN